MTNDEIATIKFDMLWSEAEKWLGVKERGKNSGPEIEMFQKEIGGVACGQAWCMAFVQYCVNRVDENYERTYGADTLKSQLLKSEHCLSVWNQTPVGARIETNLHPGLICVWQHYRNGKATTDGHTGIVKRILDKRLFVTVEGNTTNHSAVNRDGDGVYEQNRHLVSIGDLRIKGFLKPWDGAYLIK